MESRKTHVDRVIDSIKDELNQILMSEKFSISEPSEENPVIIENEMGKFKYVGDGKLFVEPRKSVEYIIMNINIEKSGNTE